MFVFSICFSLCFYRMKIYRLFVDRGAREYTDWTFCGAETWDICGKANDARGREGKKTLLTWLRPSRQLDWVNWITFFTTLVLDTPASNGWRTPTAAPHTYRAAALTVPRSHDNTKMSIIVRMRHWREKKIFIFNFFEFFSRAYSNVLLDEWLALNWNIHPLDWLTFRLMTWWRRLGFLCDDIGKKENTPLLGSCVRCVVCIMKR